MARLIHQNCLIVASTELDRINELWSLTVIVTWHADSKQRHEVLNVPGPFKARDEAEKVGLEIGKEWVLVNGTSADV